MKILTHIPVEFDIDDLLSKIHIKPDSAHVKDIKHIIETIRPETKPKVIYQMSFIQAKHEHAMV